MIKFYSESRRGSLQKQRGIRSNPKRWKRKRQRRFDLLQWPELFYRLATAYERRHPWSKSKLIWKEKKDILWLLSITFFNGDLHVIENKEINHINSENVVKEFKKLTKARKSWKQNVSKRGSKRKSGDIKQNVKPFKVKPELTWSAHYLMEWIFPIQFSLQEF